MKSSLKVCAWTFSCSCLVGQVNFLLNKMTIRVLAKKARVKKLGKFRLGVVRW